jgi:hypothetical protein
LLFLGFYLGAKQSIGKPDSSMAGECPAWKMIDDTYHLLGDGDRASVKPLFASRDPSLL